MPPNSMPSDVAEAFGKNNACIVCQTVCKTPKEKIEHSKLQQHRKKYNIYKFFANDVSKYATTDDSSALLRRYTITQEKAIGLECIHELQFPWCKTGWWACSICYESGAHYEQADRHIRSIGHLSTYLDEYHSDKEISTQRSDKSALYEELLGLRNVLYEEQGGKLLSPEMLSVNMTKEEAIQKLVTFEYTPTRELHQYVMDNNKRLLMQCTACWEVIPYTKKTMNRAWIAHEETFAHKACVAITGVFEQLDMIEVIDSDSADVRVSGWKYQKGNFFGPVCGVKHLVSSGADNYCTLCFCKIASIEEHFSSEGHIIRFLSAKKCAEVYFNCQKSSEVRRTALMEILSRIPLENDSSHQLKANKFPSIIEELSNVEDLSARDCMPPLLTLGTNSHCLVCEDCCLVIRVENTEKDGGLKVWNDHVSQQTHFDYMVRRAPIKFNDRLFIPVVSSVPSKKPNIHGKWINKEIDQDNTLCVQTLCDIGLEFVVEDEENDEVVCTLCARTYKRDAHDVIHNHIRSYMHLNQYLHMNNRELLSIIFIQSSEDAVKDLMLEWLQRSARLCQRQIYDPMFMEVGTVRDNWMQIKVYSPERAFQIASIANVPARTVSMAYVQPSLRPIICSLAPVLDAVSNDGVEKQMLDFREALNLSPCRIAHFPSDDTGRLLLKCMTCQQVFSTDRNKIIQDVWENHLFTAEHDRRVAAFEAANIDMYGYSADPSTMTVKPFAQPDPSKKVTWQWDKMNKSHNFVLNLVGLNEVVEKKSDLLNSGHRAADFFCQLCAVAIPKRSAALETHIRSAQHVICYLHKFHPMTVYEIEGLGTDDNGKSMRRCVAQTLKDLSAPPEYCIPVYDPVGEKERKSLAAIERASEIERKRQLEEARKKNREERLKREEERKLIQQQELQKEMSKKIQKIQQEKEARDKAARFEEERKRLRLIAEENVKRENEEKAKKEKEREAILSRQREREREHMKNILEQEKARVKVAEKSRTRDAAVQRGEQQSAVSSAPVHQLLMPSGVSHGYNVLPPNPYRSGLAGPKPVFSSFVPIVDQIPVYPARGEDMDISRSPSPSDTGKKAKLNDYSELRTRNSRPSLINRTVDPYVANASIIATRNDLVEFLWKQGAERIPPGELPIVFNEKATAKMGSIGIDSIYEVICIDSSDMDTFYCSQCGIWTTPSQMLEHLVTNEHKLAYLFRNYKVYHQNVMNETNSMIRQSLINQFALQIHKMEQSSNMVTNRLRAILDKASICRLWPEHVHYLDHSWKGSVPNVASVPTVKDSSKQESKVEGKPDERKRDKEKKLEKKCSDSPARRKRSRSPRHRRSPTPDRKRRRSRSRSRERSKRSRRSRSPRGRKSPHKKSSPINSDKSWMESAAAFLEKLGDQSAADKVRKHGTDSRSSGSEKRRPKDKSPITKSSNDDFSKRIAQLRNLANPELSSSSHSSYSQQPRKSARPVDVITIDDDKPILRDEKAEMRKLLGVLITMQQEAEKHGGLDPSIIDRLYSEVGLEKKEGFTSEQLLSQLCSQLADTSGQLQQSSAIDLASFGITGDPPANNTLSNYGVSHAPNLPPQSYYGSHPYQQLPPMNQPPPSHNGRDPQLEKILSGISSSVASIQRDRRSPSPIVKPLPYAIPRAEDIFTDNMSYVYPETADDKRETASSPAPQSKKERAALRRQKLLEQAEALRKQAEAAKDDDEDDDDWDSLETEMHQILENATAIVQNSSNSDKGTRKAPRNYGVPKSLQQPFPQSLKEAQPLAFTFPPNDKEPNAGASHLSSTPIAPGQKMPLARTMLPNGKALPGMSSSAVEQASNQLLNTQPTTTPYGYQPQQHNYYQQSMNQASGYATGTPGSYVYQPPSQQNIISSSYQTPQATFVSQQQNYSAPPPQQPNVTQSQTQQSQYYGQQQYYGNNGSAF